MGLNDTRVESSSKIMGRRKGIAHISVCKLYIGLECFGEAPIRGLAPGVVVKLAVDERVSGEGEEGENLGKHMRR